MQLFWLFNFRNQYQHNNNRNNPLPFVVTGTTHSIQDPLPGHESHQVVIAAPLRDDEKIYSGIASFTSSQPVEVVILHNAQFGIKFIGSFRTIEYFN